METKKWPNAFDASLYENEPSGDFPFFGSKDRFLVHSYKVHCFERNPTEHYWEINKVVETNEI